MDKLFQVRTIELLFWAKCARCIVRTSFDTSIRQAYSIVWRSFMPPNLIDYRDRKSTRLNSSHLARSRMPSSA